MAAFMTIWRLCTFTNIVCLVFLLYSGTLVYNVWTFFNPVKHTGTGEGHGPLWKNEEKFDIYFYVSQSTNQVGKLVHKEMHMLPSRHLATNVTIQVPKKVRQGASLYCHVLVTRADFPPLPTNSAYSPDAVLHRLQLLTMKSACRRNTTRTLLSTQETTVETSTTATCPFLKPKVVARLVQDRTEYPWHAIPNDIIHYMQFSGKKYKPILFLDEIWLLKEHLMPLNESSTTLTIDVQYSPIPLGLWRLMIRFDEALKMLEKMIGSESDEPDNMRRMITETPPWLLAVTFAVTILHLMFDVLAFKNDIVFWRSRKSMEGLSSNNVVAELFCQIIITLYLFNNDTGWPILLPMVVGLVIQVWKTGIAVKLKAKGKDSSTAQADAQAMRWLSYLLYPLVIGYAIYSLLYKEHKGWYSWCLESMASAVYAFGFALMTPQLYINYELKSVANLPWRVFMYRACNTFIDDLFAFIIRMPTMHRLSAFRDDVIFVIYLFQRWLYPVDPNRHEGFEGEDLQHSAHDVSDVSKKKAHKIE